MTNNASLTKLEGFCIFAIMIISQTFMQAVPQSGAEAGNAAWIAYILAAAVAAVLFFMLLKFLTSFGGKNLYDISDMVFGQKVSKVFQSLMQVYLFFYAAVKLHQCTKMLKLFTYQRTHTMLIAFFIIISAVIAAFYLFKGLGRMVGISFFVIIACLALILIFSYSQYNINYLFPILGFGSEEILKTAFFSLSNFAVVVPILLFMDTFESPKVLKKTGNFAMIVSGIISVIVMLANNLAFPYTSMKGNFSGMLDLTKGIYINKLFQRFEPLFILIVCIGVMFELIICLLAIKKTWCSLFEIPSEKSKYVVAPIGIIVFCLSFISKDFSAYNSVLTKTQRTFGFAFVAVLLVILYIGAKIRKMPGRAAADKTTKIGGGGKGHLAAKMSVLMIPILLFGLLSSGCQDYKEIDEIVYPVVMGCDMGENQKYRFTLKIMSEGEVPGSEKNIGAEPLKSEEKAEQPSDIICVEAPTGAAAMNLISTVVPKSISLTHIKLVVFSERLAKTDMSEITESLIKSNDVKNTLIYVICKDNAQSFLSESESDLFGSLSLSAELIANKTNSFNNYMITSLSEFFNTSTSEYGDPIVMYGGISGETIKAPMNLSDQDDQNAKTNHEKDSESGFLSKNNNPNPEYYPGEVPVASANKSEMAGAAVFADYKMTGILNIYETKMYILMSKNFDNGYITFNDLYNKDKFVVVNFENSAVTSIKCNIDQDGKASFIIKVFLTGTIKDYQNVEVDYAQQKNVDKLREKIAVKLQEDMQKTIYKLQKEYGSDALNLGGYVARNFMTIGEWNAYNWQEKYPLADIKIEVFLSM